MIAAAWRAQNSLDVVDEPENVGTIAIPRQAAQISRLDGSEAERRRHAIERNRDEDVALKSDIGFVRHPGGMNGCVRPDDDDASSSLELIADDTSPRLTRRDCPVPKDRPAALLKRFDEHLDALTVLARVADEYVTHRWTETFRNGTISTLTSNELRRRHEDGALKSALLTSTLPAAPARLLPQR